MAPLEPPPSTDSGSSALTDGTGAKVEPAFNPTGLILGAIALLCIGAVAVVIVWRKSQVPNPLSANMHDRMEGTIQLIDANPPTAARPITEQLKELKELFDQGLISEADFEAKKQEILTRV